MLDLIKNKNAIIVINKTDLQKNLIINNEEIKENGKDIVFISTIEEKGIKELYDAIEKMFELNIIDYDSSEIITNARQKQYIMRALEAVNEAENAIENNMPIDITAIALKQILEELNQITGESASEDIINEIFKKFCLGK